MGSKSSKEWSRHPSEITLEKAGITINKNMVPFDEKSPMVTSGIRIGTSALTTRGFNENEMEEIAKLIDNIIQNIEDEKVIKDTRNKVLELCSAFPLYEENVIDEVPQLP